MGSLSKKITALALTLTLGSILFPGASSAQTVEELQEQIAQLQAQLQQLLQQLAELQGGAPTGGIPGIPAGFSFEKNLYYGMSDPDVKYLQIVLNSDPETQLATEGPGSPGNETQYFGPLTKAAVIKFQEKYADEVLAPWGLTEGTGFVGSTTRAKLNELITVTPPTPTCSDYTTEEECTAAGCYWYEDACHSEPQAVEGVLRVRLADDTPAAGIVPSDAMAEFAKFAFENTGTEAITIESLKFKRFGVGSPSDFDGVYLFQGDTRLTPGRTVSASTNYVEFNNIDVEVPGGETIYLSIWVDGDGASTQQHGFKLESADDITATADVEGDFPIEGNLMAFSNVTEGVLTVNSDGTVSNPTIGETEAPVEKFSLTAANEDIDLWRIAFEQTGTADLDEITNWGIYYADEKIGTGTVSGDTITFVLDEPFEIGEGQTKIFEIKADIGAGVDPGDTIDLEIDEAIDVYGIGQSFGFGVAVTDNQSGDNVTVQGGTVTFTDQGPNAGDVKIDGNDVVFLRFTLSAGVDITVDDLDVVIDTNGGSQPNDLSDVRIRNAETGETLMGPKTPTSTTANGSEKLDFTSDFDVSAGETLTLEITADIDDGVQAGEDFRICLAMSAGTVCGATAAAPVIKDAENNTITDIVPSTNITGEWMNAVSSYLTVALASSPTGSIHVQNSTDIPALGVIFGAGEASDIEVTDLTVKFTCADATPSTVQPEDVISAVYLEDEAGALIAGPEAVNSTSDSVTFDGLNIEIGAGETEKVIVTVDIGPLSAAVACYADILGSAGTTTNVTAYDEDGSAVTVYDEDGSGTSGDWQTDSNLNDPGTLDADQDNADAEVELEFITAGRLLIEDYSPAVSESIIVGGSTDVLIDKISFTSEYEGMYVEKLTFTATNADSFDGVTIEYPDETGAIVSQSADFVEATSSVTFSGMTMYVPKNDTVTLTIKADIKSVADPAVSSGDTIDVDWDYDGDIKVVSASGTVDEDATDNSGLITDTAGTVSGFAANITSTDHYVYATKPTFALNSASPSGSRTPSTTDTVLIFDVTADANKAVKVRQGDQERCESAPTAIGADSTGTSTTKVEGSYSGKLMDSTALANGDGIEYDQGATGILDDYAYVSFWFYWHDAGGANALPADDIAFHVADTSGNIDHERAFGTSSTTYSEDTWHFIELQMPAGTGSADRYFGININDNTIAGANAGNYILIDDIRFYNEKITVDFASDASLSTSGNATSATLLQGSTIVAQGYVNVSSTSAASVTFIPVGTYGTINIPAGETETFSVVINTTSIVNNQGTEDDLLTPSITYGTSSSAGDFYWYDGYTTVTWNDTPGLVLTGNTLVY